MTMECLLVLECMDAVSIMRCIFCKKPVFGDEGTTVPGEGPSHKECYQTHLIFKRMFQNVEISALNDNQLTDLKDLVLAEINDRTRDTTCEDDDIELF